MLSRRHVLQVLAAAPVLATCAGEALPDPIAAWRTPAAGETDPRRHALAHAILAPNPHNMQPWLVELVGADEIVFSPDLTRLLPATDPPNRQIVLGCGTFLELLDLAARENGHRAEITLWPEGEPQPNLDARPIAHVRLLPDAAAPKDPLFAHILRRRTNREPFDAARIPAAADLEAIAAAGAAPGLTSGWTNAAEETQSLRDLVWRGWSLEMQTPAALAESVEVMRLGKAEIARHRDGIAMDFPMIEPLKAVGFISRKALLDPASGASQQGRTMWKALADSAPGFVWIVSADNSRSTQIAAGRAYARTQLAATEKGLSMHPWSMTLQEYPEMAALYAETLDRFAARQAAPVQMLSRVGYAPEVAPSPRRGLEAHLVP
jgi:hypothetical protein